ncbi:hypothetical protein ACFWZ1_14995 [Frateuria sp. GZRe14]|uniref:hypothetical protein n=1 Tax=Frateuria sp. GZRe14 TaxID=3351534 RepID=UPI003EDC813A
MKDSANLSQVQKQRLAVLEPSLRACVAQANVTKAKEVTLEIQKLLRATGHETRLLQAKNWLFEAALEAGEVDFAKKGFKGVFDKTSNKTRVHLEAAALLAICHLREGNLELARPFLAEAVDNVRNIRSERRRRQFHARLLARFQDEAILAGLRNECARPLDLDVVDNKAVTLVREASEDKIYEELGKAVPMRARAYLEEIHQSYVLRLPAPERKFLPPPIREDKNEELGRKTSAALKRVAWRALCSKDSEIYQAWSNGLSVVYDKRYISAAIVACFNSSNIAITMLAASAAALAIKFGAETFCEVYAPRSIMIGRDEVDQ